MIKRPSRSRSHSTDPAANPTRRVGLEKSGGTPEARFQWSFFNAPTRRVAALESVCEFGVSQPLRPEASQPRSRGLSPRTRGIPPVPVRGKAAPRLGCQPGATPDRSARRSAEYETGTPCKKGPRAVTAKPLGVNEGQELDPNAQIPGLTPETPFIWTAEAVDIPERVKRGRANFNNSQSA